LPVFLSAQAFTTDEFEAAFTIWSVLVTANVRATPREKPRADLCI
jgi:hypothetical protein